MTRQCEQNLVGAVQELKKLFEFQGQRQPLVLDDAYTRGYVHLLWQSLQKRRSTASGHFFVGPWRPSRNSGNKSLRSGPFSHMG